MKKNLVFRLLQLGSEWTPGARQRNIFNVPCWGLMVMFLQCSDAVGSVTGRASGLWKVLQQGSLEDLQGPGLSRVTSAEY